MLYEINEYFIWSFLYSKVEGDNFRYQKKYIDTDFLYTIYNYSIEKKINIFEINKIKLENIIEVLLEKRRFKDSVKEKIVNIFLNELEDIKEKTKSELELCKENKIKYLTLESDEYFEKLKKLEKPPFIIFYLGELPKENELKNSVALIGSREADEYGKKVATIMGEVLSQNNIWNISGLALGCDQAGHEGSINSGGKTGAILANGLASSIYPNKNNKLAKKILDTGGFLLSEISPSMKVSKISLVERDRLQSALTDGILVIECGEKSGTLHAIGTGMKLKKEIMVWKPLKLEKIDNHIIAGNIALLNGEFNKLKNDTIKRIKKYKIIEIQTKEQLIENIIKNEKKSNENLEEKIKIIKFDNMTLEF